MFVRGSVGETPYLGGKGKGGKENKKVLRARGKGEWEGKGGRRKGKAKRVNGSLRPDPPDIQ